MTAAPAHVTTGRAAPPPPAGAPGPAGPPQLADGVELCRFAVGRRGCAAVRPVAGPRSAEVTFAYESARTHRRARAQREGRAW